MDGPYRGAEPIVNAFPRCNKVFSVRGAVESYSRALLSVGHGYPIFDVAGDWRRSPLHLSRGPSPGDIGILNPQGDFVLAFNIFADPNDPIHQNETPSDFVPTKPPDPTEIIRIPNYFQPGTVIASKGVDVRHISNSPLYVLLFAIASPAGTQNVEKSTFRLQYVKGAFLFFLTVLRVKISYRVRPS